MRALAEEIRRLNSVAITYIIRDVGALTAEALVPRVAVGASFGVDVDRRRESV